MTRILLVDRPGSAQTVLQFGNLAITQSDPDYIPLGGRQSHPWRRLVRAVVPKHSRAEGLHVRRLPNLSAGRWPGIWGASASVRTPVTEPAVREFFREFDRLQDTPVSALDLERAKRSIIGSLPRRWRARTLFSAERWSWSRTGCRRLLGHLPGTNPGRHRRGRPAGREKVPGQEPDTADRGRGAQPIEFGLKTFGTVEVVPASELGGGVGGRGGRRR